MKEEKNILKKIGKNYYKLYDEKGHEIGIINSLYEKKQSNWLKGISVFILTEDGNLILEKRSKNTMLTPNDIDLVSGHRDGDEKGKEAAYRELKEELGIKKKKVLKLKKVKNETPLVFRGGRNFFISFYVTKLKEKMDYLEFQEAEVQDVLIVPMEKGFEMIRNGETKFPYAGNDKKFEEIFEKVREYYKKSLEDSKVEKNEGESR